MTHEQHRLDEAHQRQVPWRKWGPYLSERQWGTVREDYSADGNAWEYFTHEQSRSRVYRWGEDGIAGLCDDKGRLCFALALWNERDAILKERLFGLTNSEGNHGEDVKEYYFYLDSTPTHSYMKYLYKYPQAAFPYEDLVATNHERGRDDYEYELLDTGVFDDDRYFDVFVEYAKGSAEDVLIKISVHNRGPEAAVLHLLPTLWFRNTWSWKTAGARPSVGAIDGPHGIPTIAADHADLGRRFLYAEGAAALLFTDNETNNRLLFGTANTSPFVKDGINDYVVSGRPDTVNPARTGTKSAAHYTLTVGAHDSATIRLRLTDVAKTDVDPFADFNETMRTRLSEADEFYASITPPTIGADAAAVMRQALAGMLWTKQYYNFDLDLWLEEHSAHPFDVEPKMRVRNRSWFHMVNDDVISMPDKWEYPWYAAWDLAFHTGGLMAVDIDFAKQQLELMLRELYLHPSGQIPAYEWNFSDVNPPVHAWATIFVYTVEKELRGVGDIDFLKRAFQKLLLNFTWWVNRKDPTGRNVFEGGFLGLDNIGVFDRSAPLPTGGHLEQADGTAWMALFAQNMLEIAVELTKVDPMYEDMALKFAEHFMWIAAAMDRIGVEHDELWDEEDGFFYDLLRFPDGRAERLKIRSLVGLLSLCATTVFEPEESQPLGRLVKRFEAFLSRHPEVAANISPPARRGVGGRVMLAILNEEKLRRVLVRLLDETEFLSPHGVRSLSRHHKDQPYEFRFGPDVWRVDYEPAESSSAMFGGNSNWRGPIWMPINILIVRALVTMYSFYGDELTIECPTGSGRQMNLFEVGQEIANRLTGIFLRDEEGRRPVFGGATKFQTDPHWRDYLLFYEYFHGDNGAGLGASHQTGWTGIIARLIQFFGYSSSERILAEGARAAVARDQKRSAGDAEGDRSGAGSASRRRPANRRSR